MTETAWQEKTLTQKILARQDQLENLRRPYNGRMSDIIDFCQPGLTGWTGTDTEGRFRGEKIYEGTPPWALRTMVSGWIGNLISESNRWLKYVFPDKILRDDDNVNEYLQDREDYMYSIYRRSEIYSAMNPYARAGFSVGSPVIIPYESKDRYSNGKIKCEMPHPKENYHGSHDCYHRKYQLTVIDAVDKFMNGKVPEDVNDGKLNAGLLNDYKNGNHFTRYTFIRAVYRQDDPILEGQKQDYRNKPWMEFYIQADISEIEQKKEPLLVQGWFTKPHIKWDYEINDDEFYARTPSWNAIMDIRSGQEIARQRMEAGQRALNPPMWSLRKFRGHINMRPKGFTYAEPMDYDKPPIPIQENVNYQVGVDVHQMILQAVERWYHTDLFRILSRITEMDKAAWPTATHIIQLNAEKAVLLSPEIGQFTNVLREIDARVSDIEERAGRMPEKPDIIKYCEYITRRKMPPEVEFIGPLAQMQQKGITLGRIEAGLGIIQSFINTFGTSLAYKVKPSIAMERALEQVGWYQDANVPENEYQQILEGIAAQNEQDKQTARLATAVDAVPKLGKAIEPGSPLGALMEAAV